MMAFTNNDLDAQKSLQAKEDKKGKMEPSWVTNIGEQARQMKLMLNKYTDQNDIIVLGESTLFILNENGSIRFQKRYSFSPSCFVPYNMPGMGHDLYCGPQENMD